MSEESNAKGSRYKLTSLGIFLVPCALRLALSAMRLVLEIGIVNLFP